jgi:hypothetical protein
VLGRELLRARRHVAHVLTATGPLSELRQSRLTLPLGRLPRALASRPTSSRHGVGVNLSTPADGVASTTASA